MPPRQRGRRNGKGYTMLMMGKFKEDVLLAVDHAFLVLVPE